MIPPMEIVVITALNPPLWPGTKNPNLEKFEAWKLVMASTTMVKTGTATLTTVTVSFVRDIHRTPMRLSVTNIAMSTMATTMPVPLKVPLAFTHPWAHDSEDRYWIVASTSMGATVAAWM